MMIQKIAARFGYTLIRTRKMPVLASHLKKVLDRLRVDVVVDAGANHGQFGLLLRSLGFRGTILSFEPVGANFKAVEAVSRGDERWQVHGVGLGAEDGAREINVFETSEFSSILAPSGFGLGSFQNHLQSRRTESIQLRRLDGLVDELALRGKRIFLKMDTQGFDLEVFRGAQGILDDVVGLLSEVSFQPIYDGMPDYHEALAAYEGHGFQATGLFPVCTSQDLTVIEMDCVMIRTQKASATVS